MIFLGKCLKFLTLGGKPLLRNHRRTRQQGQTARDYAEKEHSKMIELEAWLGVRPMLRKYLSVFAFSKRSWPANCLSGLPVLG
jgi:hypothetical protein